MCLRLFNKYTVATATVIYFIFTVLGKDRIQSAAYSKVKVILFHWKYTKKTRDS